jgi:hypothetical protein
MDCVGLTIVDILNKKMKYEKILLGLELLTRWHTDFDRGSDSSLVRYINRSTERCRAIYEKSESKRFLERSVINLV